MKLLKAGLIDVHAIDKSIKVDLVNSDPNKNYFQENFYSGLNKAYLREEVAKKYQKLFNLLGLCKTQNF